ncbi:MAG: sigma-70 family RNA polymerase sigma factor [Planctomycetota bacterium]
MGHEPSPKGDRPPSDQELLQRYAGGDEEAFRVFWERYEPRLVRVASRYVGADLAQDAVQNLAMKFAEHPEIFDHSQSFMPWATTVLARESVSMLRRERAKKRGGGKVQQEPIDGLGDASAGTQSPDEIVELEEFRRRLRRRLAQCLWKLEKVGRKAILLRCKGMGFMELAQRLVELGRLGSANPGSAAKIVNRVLVQLRRCVAEDNNDFGDQS